MLAAAQAFFDEGEARPTAEALAERAGVSPASLYRYFDRLDELPHLVFQAQVDAVAPLLRIDVRGRPLEDRIRAFVRSRLDVYEQVQGIARMGRARAIDHGDVADALAEARAGWRRQVRTVFGPELSGRSRNEVRDVTAMVDTLVSFEAWDLLAVVHGLPRRAIESQLLAAVRSTLTA